MNQDKQMSADTPIIFCNGTDFFDNLSKEYVRHDTGLFILAPSGTGKTTYVSSQKTKHWIDGDYLWPATNADLSSGEWSYDFDIVHEINNRSDIITHQARKLGFWIIGSSNSFLKPDGIVLPPWDQHIEFIKKRENSTSGNGATSDDTEGVKNHREWIAKWEKQGAPRYESIAEAVDALTKNIKK